jgi:hypothetical protein
MAKKISSSVGKGGKNALPDAGLNGPTCLKLQQAGMSNSGISQLAAGIPVSNTQDRDLLRRIVALSMGG